LSCNNHPGCILLINHGEREAIEVFTIDAKGAKPAISWAGCVILPKEVMANSVAILPGGGFLTTKYFDPTAPNSIKELIQGKISGAVYEWHPGGNVNSQPDAGFRCERDCVI
jgi:hypothetical protein